MNSIFVNIESLEKANAPRYIRNKRRNKLLFENEHITYSSGSSSETFDDEMSFEENMKNTILNDYNISNTALNSNPQFKANNTDMQEFNAHIPSNGGFFIKKDGTKLNFINTCTIDNYLLAIWYLSKIMPNFHNRIGTFKNKVTLIKIIENIDILNWDYARQLWFTEIMKMDFRNKNTVIDFFGSIENYFLKYVYDYQMHNIIQKCSDECNKNGTIFHAKSEILNLGKTKDDFTLLTDIYNTCPKCKKHVTCNFEFLYDPIYVFIEMSDNLTIKNIPKLLNMNNKMFRLLCAIIHRSEIKHFVSVFEIENQLYLIDDLSPNGAHLLLENDKINYFALNVTSALYYLF